MGQREEIASRALMQARAFLQRWRDAATRSERDDLVQDVAIAVLDYHPRLRNHACFPAVVRTISRRARWKALQRVHSRRIECVPDEWLTDRGGGRESPEEISIGGSLVPKDWLLAQLDEALEKLAAENRQLLLAYYSGLNCEDAASRFGLTETVVKMRLYRSRRRLRKEIEGRARAAGYLGS
ncbi:MAG: hypothetical protein Fur0037_25170 [Planctomycetota bacterium]